MLDSLARALVRAGHEVVLFTTGDSTCPVERRFELPEAETHRMGVAVPELRHVMAAYEALRDVDIIHDHTIIGPVYSQLVDSPPVVTTNHGPFNDELRAVYRRVAEKVPLIAISRHQASTAGDVPVAAVIHHGVDPESFEVGDGSGDDQGEYFLFLGRMAEEKGAARAAEIARRAGVRLIIAAKMREPWEVAYFNEKVAPLLDDRIVFVGEVGFEEKVRLLGGARALLNPIRWPEPFGMVMVEAMACGTPVLAFPEGAASEIVEDRVTGFLCRDEDEMARRLSDVPEIDRQLCRSRVEKHFSSDRMAEDHLRLYRRVLEERVRLA